MTYPLLKEFAMNHRSNSTQAEEVLWNLVKTKQLEGHKNELKKNLELIVAALNSQQV